MFCRVLHMVRQRRCMSLGRACWTLSMMFSGCPPFKVRSRPKSFVKTTIPPMMNGRKVARLSWTSTDISLHGNSWQRNGKHGLQMIHSRTGSPYLGSCCAAWRGRMGFLGHARPDSHLDTAVNCGWPFWSIEKAFPGTKTAKIAKKLDEKLKIRWIWTKIKWI